MDFFAFVIQSDISVSTAKRLKYDRLLKRLQKFTKIRSQVLEVGIEMTNSGMFQAKMLV